MQKKKKMNQHHHLVTGHLFVTLVFSLKLFRESFLLEHFQYMHINLDSTERMINIESLMNQDMAAKKKKVDAKA